MPRFFAETDPGGHAVITGQDVYHIMGPLRKGVGDELPIRDHEMGYMGRIVSMNSREISLEILFSQELSERGSRLVHLGMSLIDLKDMDLLIREVTELGVLEIHPLIARRSNVREIGEKRLKRWRQIVSEGMKQCQRRSTPLLHEVSSLNEFLIKTAPSWPCRLVASLESELSIQDCKVTEAGILIGPEGGFTPEEMEKIHVSGFTSVHMGKTTLRAYTAAVTAVGILAM